jgi:hypothetical protein
MASIDLDIAKCDHEIIEVTQRDQLAEITYVVFVVTVGEADPLVLAIGKA